MDLFLQSLKDISRIIIGKTAKKNEYLDSKSIKLVIRKCHEALNNSFLASNQEYNKEIKKKNYVTIINNYLELINNIKPYNEIISTIFSKEQNDNIYKITNNKIRYCNLNKAYEAIQAYKEELSKSHKKIIQLPLTDSINSVMINFIYENDNISHVKSILNNIYQNLHSTKIPNINNKSKIICSIKNPINKTAILYYKFMLQVKRFIQLAKENKVLNGDEQKFINILEEYINKDSLKIAEIFNLPELEIYTSKTGYKSKKNHKPLIEDIQTDDPVKLLINLIVKIDIAKELARKRQMIMYSEKGKKQDSLIID